MRCIRTTGKTPLGVRCPARPVETGKTCRNSPSIYTDISCAAFEIQISSCAGADSLSQLASEARAAGSSSRHAVASARTKPRQRRRRRVGMH